MYGLDRDKPYDVVAIGNAILDVLAFTDESLLEKHGMVKGTMQLIDAPKAIKIYKDMGQAEEVSGGSAANTLAGMAQLGARTGFIGKVHDDQLGEIYRHDLTAVGVDFTTPPTVKGPPTGRSYIVVTPDGERTMNTFLGAGSEIYDEDIDEKMISNTKILLGEGYQWSTPNNKQALSKAFEMARQHRVKVAFTLSDVFCVQAHRDDFIRLLDDTFDILFANEAEISAMYPGKSLQEIIQTVQGKADVIAITRSEHGSVIVTRDGVVEVPATRVDKLVDSTGAGDLYAAGFLYGYVHAMPLTKCAQLGGACAAEIIQQLGARCVKPLKELLAA